MESTLYIQSATNSSPRQGAMPACRSTAWQCLSALIVLLLMARQTRRQYQQVQCRSRRAWQLHRRLDSHWRLRDVIKLLNLPVATRSPWLVQGRMEGPTARHSTARQSIQAAQHTYSLSLIYHSCVPTLKAQSATESTRVPPPSEPRTCSCNQVAPLRQKQRTRCYPPFTGLNNSFSSSRERMLNLLLAANMVSSWVWVY